MTKAEKIYKDTRYECRKHIETWGYKINPNGTAIGYNGLITEELTPTRTLNEITKILERKRKGITIDLKLNVLTQEEAEKETQILNMIETTLNNQKRKYKEL